jgi:hypothetical protein
MKPDYIQIYNRNTKAIKMLMWLGVVLALLGITGLIWYGLTIEYIIYAGSFWQMGFLIFQGVITVFIMWNALKSKRYFISWDEHIIHYLLPKSKLPVLIKIFEIQSVEIDNTMVTVLLKNQEQKLINLNLFYLPKRRQVISYFQNLRENLEN